MIAESFDEAENVIPAAAIEPGRVIAQLIQDLVHFERGENRFNKHSGADGAARHAEGILSEVEDIVPQPGFQMALQFRQVEVWTGAVLDRLFCVMEKEQSEVE